MQATGYSYKVKIINPLKKSDVVVRQLHRFNSKFDSLTALRVKLIDEFADTVPDTVKFNVGYFDGRQQAKLWLVTREDLESMYSKYRTGEITLWCDGRQSDRDRNGEEVRSKRKRDSEANVSKRQEKEEEVESVYKDLKEKHGSKYDTPRLRLWSRMICSNLHEDMDNPPDIPAFSGSVSKKPRKESVSDVLAGAAVAFAKAFTSEKANQESESVSVSHPPVTSGVSPSKAIELRMKNFEQLRYLHHLYDDGILSTKEFTEQKQNILSSLQKLS